jgi:transposase
VNEIKEVLRAWLGGGGLRTAAERAGLDRKTARRYVEAGEAAGLLRGEAAGGEAQLTDELIGWKEQIASWVKADLQLTNIHGKLERQGVVVPYRTLHRFATEQCDFGAKRITLRVADGKPGAECQIDFGRLGLLHDPASGRRRAVHALIFTAVYSRHMFVHLSFTQTLDAVVAGCERAWEFFGGVFAVLIPDNMSPIIASADPINPTFTVGWLDYVQARGFATDPARVRSPKDKPRVERTVQYVRENFWRGEEFTDLAQAQSRVEVWCRTTAGMRIHGTTAQRPAEDFTASEQPLLLAAPTQGYDRPLFSTPKVARDLHVEVARGLYSVPGELIGQRVDVRADTHLVKVFSRGQLIKTHPRVRAGGRSTDPTDYPVERRDYALRDVVSLTSKAGAVGPSVGIYAVRLLDVPLPWTSMRTVYRLLGLARSYGAQAVDAACARALELDVVDVNKVSRMLEQAREREPLPPAAAKVVGGTSRFARDPQEFQTELALGTEADPA